MPQLRELYSRNLLFRYLRRDPYPRVYRAFAIIHSASIAFRCDVHAASYLCGFLLTLHHSVQLCPHQCPLSLFQGTTSVGLLVEW